MKALTIDAYWAWAIAHGSKRVENRSWKTNYRGPLLIHAAKSARRDELAIESIESIDLDSLASAAQAGAIRGHAVAVCELVDCVPAEELGFDPWAFGPWCWMLENVRVLGEPVAMRGKQGLWSLMQRVSAGNRLLKPKQSAPALTFASPSPTAGRCLLTPRFLVADR